MAARKKSTETNTTKKTTTKTTKKTSTTAKKTTTRRKSKPKAPETVKLTYNPVFSASMSFTAYLAEPAERIISGRSVVTTRPMIEGLPETLTVQRGEIIEVTKDQYKALLALGFVESEADRERRITLEGNIPEQFPQRLSYDQMKSTSQNVGTPEIMELYRDKLYLV